jgi:hypothetical protein
MFYFDFSLMFWVVFSACPRLHSSLVPPCKISLGGLDENNSSCINSDMYLVVLKHTNVE